MKIGRSLSELACELIRQTQSKKDYLVDTRKLALVCQDKQTVQLHGFNGEGFPLRETAHAQLAETLGIPKPYYDRLKQQKPELLCVNANAWLAQPARKLVRCLDGNVRAVLSERFRPLDHFDLAEAVLPKLQQLGARIESCEVTEQRLYLKAVTERIHGEIKPGDIVQAGLVISNSETGQGSLKIEELAFRLICTNGMIHGAAIRRNHVGRSTSDGAELREAREFYRDETRRADDRALWLKVQDTVAALLDPRRFAQRIEQYKEAGRRKIEADPLQVIETTTRRFGLTEAEKGSVLRNLIEGADLSAWGLANDVTATSQELDSYERATELEAVGGQIVELPRSEWAALTVSA